MIPPEPSADSAFDIFAQRLTPARARDFQMIHAGIAFACMFGLAVNFFLYGLGSESPPAEGPVAFMWLLTYLFIGLVVVCAAVAAVLPRWLLSPGRLRAGLAAAGEKGSAGWAEKGLRMLRTALAVRLAFLAGPSLIGLVLSLFALRIGVLFYNPEFAILAVPVCITLVYLGSTFPTHDRLLAMVKSRIVAKLGPEM
ncbi:MAG TPA: hypothetical protein VHI13_07475 [Candidatus Kapabacteria bacterium]|nr:hypothetical protein [Candidatus Kapabacteria bacterium]